MKHYRICDVTLVQSRNTVNNYYSIHFTSNVVDFKYTGPRKSKHMQLPRGTYSREALGPSTWASMTKANKNLYIYFSFDKRHMLNDSIARVKGWGHVTVVKAGHALCNEIHAYHIAWKPCFPYIVDEDLSTFTLLGKCDRHVSITVVSFRKLRRGLMLLKKHAL